MALGPLTFTQTTNPPNRMGLAPVDGALMETARDVAELVPNKLGSINGHKESSLRGRACNNSSAYPATNWAFAQPTDMRWNWPVRPLLF